MPQPINPDDLPHVASLEPRWGWWSESGAFGGRIQQQFPQVSGVELDVFSIDHAPGPPRPLAFNLFRSNLNLGGGGGRGGTNAEVYARITYGAGGVTHQFVMDATLGTQVSLVANAVRLSFVSYAPNADSAYSAPTEGEIILGATLGLGAVAPGGAATFTTQYVSVAAAAEQTYSVAPFARRVLPFQPLVSAAELHNWQDLRLRFCREGGATQSTVYLGEVGPALFTDGIQIPGGAFDVRLSNLSGAARSLGLIFLLGV
jgi:hypothetical protein